MRTAIDATRDQLAREISHWSLASIALGALARDPAPRGWARLERHVGVAIERVLSGCVDRLNREAAVLRAQLAATETEKEVAELRSVVIRFRERYVRAETLVEFFSDALASRRESKMARYLGACDVLAVRAMVPALAAVGQQPPPVLTYLDKGLGASVLKAGLRLWDGRSVNPVAAIRIVLHNLHTPTSLLHEAGHQVAHTTHWNEEVRDAIELALFDLSPELARCWSSWTSEIVADAFAFASCGYAAVCALSDVLAGADEMVFRILPDDPHPPAYLRTLLGVAMCTRFFGAGPWDDLARAWHHEYGPPADEAMRAFVERSELALPRLVEVLLERPMRAFGGRSLADVVDPTRVRPEVLLGLQRSAGPSLYASDHSIERECLRLLALCGYRIATEPQNARTIYEIQEQWMERLGAMSLDAR